MKQEACELPVASSRSQIGSLHAGGVAVDFMDASILCMGLCDMAALIFELFYWAQVAAGLRSCCTALCVCAGFLGALGAGKTECETMVSLLTDRCWELGCHP